MEEENIYLTLSCTGVWLPIRFLSNTHSTKEFRTLYYRTNISKLELVETLNWWKLHRMLLRMLQRLVFSSAKSLRKIVEIIQFLKSKFDTYFYCKLQIFNFRHMIKQTLNSDNVLF